MRRKWTMRKIGLLISVGVSLLLFLALRLTAGYLSGRLDAQTFAGRWNENGGAAQISCFFSADYGTPSSPGYNVRQIESFEHTLDNKLSEAAVTLEAENPSARLWVDAYSASGKLSVSHGRTSIQADAIGIGGDFFLFHPLKLKSGAYFSGNDLNQDYVLLDENAAWKLFGSNDIAGQLVEIGGAPHLVAGVVENPSGSFAKAAGVKDVLVYVSCQTLSACGQSNGINHYEICMPNPISGFAEKIVRDSFGADELRVEIIENSTRYSFLNNIKRVVQFGARSMNGKAIIYPYWENMARGYEDIVTALTVLWLLFLLYPTVVALAVFCIWWKHKGWTLKEAFLAGKDRLERLAERLRAKRGERSGRKSRSGKA